MTGDIFRGLEVPGSTPEETAFDLTMVLSHPSAMRKGADLEPRVRAAPIAPVKGVSSKKWTPGYYTIFPLPLLREEALANGFEVEERGWATLLELGAPVASNLLDVTRRVACLSPDGIHLLLQCLVNADTRFPVREALIAETFSTKLAEIEMLQTWNEELAAPLVDQGSDLEATLRAAASEFEQVLAEPNRRDGNSIRSLLGRVGGAGEAERLLVGEIRQRKGES